MRNMPDISSQPSFIYHANPYYDTSYSRFLIFDTIKLNMQDYIYKMNNFMIYGFELINTHFCDLSNVWNYK